MGVGSEVFEAVRSGRYGIGIELKRSYYRQAGRNLTDLTAPAGPTVGAEDTLFEATAC
jgi:hypothetical protein